MWWEPGQCYHYYAADHVRFSVAHCAHSCKLQRGINYSPIECIGIAIGIIMFHLSTLLTPIINCNPQSILNSYLWIINLLSPSRGSGRRVGGEVLAADAGVYSCVFSNTAGETSR